MNNNYMRKEIDINDILLNTKNPRFEEVNSQDEALKIMLDEYEQKIYNLAKHITENGMNPTELSAVIMTNNDKYIVLDGNRRLTALKILINPDLLNKNYEKLKSKILKLNRSNVPTKINAIVFQNEEDANLWIKLKHTGENDGIGTVEWTALQQSRFDNDKYPLSIQLLKYMEKANLIKESISKNIKKLSISSLERLLSDPDVRTDLSITRFKNELHFPVPNNNIKNILNNFLSEMLTDDFNVNKIRSKDDRKAFMNYFKQKYNITEDDIKQLKNSKSTTAKEYEKLTKESMKVSNKKESNSKNQNDKKESENNTSSKKSIIINRSTPKSKINSNSKVFQMPSTLDRKYLIPTNFSLTINNKKINDIYLELKKIPVNEFPNIVGACFRVFLELSIDYYINVYKSEIHVNPNDRLSKKLEKVKLHIKNKLNLDNNELKEINRAISSDKNNIVSVDILHAYIHSTIAQANADGLKITWNNYEKFFEYLYKSINDLSLAKA